MRKDRYVWAVTSERPAWTTWQDDWIQVSMQWKSVNRLNPCRLAFNSAQEVRCQIFLFGLGSVQKFSADSLNQSQRWPGEPLCLSFGAGSIRHSCPVPNRGKLWKHVELRQLQFNQMDVSDCEARGPEVRRDTKSFLSPLALRRKNSRKHAAVSTSWLRLSPTRWLRNTPMNHTLIQSEH